MAQVIDCICQNCGSAFQKRDGKPSKFCCQSCRGKASYKRVSKRTYGMKMLALKCGHCAKPFEYVSTGINPPKYCGDFCRSRARAKNAKSKPLCVVTGCKNPRAYSSGICNPCYQREKRTGTLDRRKYAYRTLGTNGYVRISKQEHPLAINGWLYEHRMVLYDLIGSGAHACHWCGKAVVWVKGKCSKGSLVPDHLDGDRTNNSPENLVPSCNPCNAARGLFQAWVERHSDDPWLWKLYQQFSERRKDAA
jgi:hypothetical protein